MFTALRCFISEYLKRSSCFCEEVCGGFHDEAARMPLPHPSDPYINCRGLLGVLDSQRVAVIVAAINWRRSKVNDGVVSTELFIQICADGGKEIRHVAGPIGSAVYSPAIAQYNCGVLGIRDVLEFALYVEDRPLCRLF